MEGYDYLERYRKIKEAVNTAKSFKISDRATRREAVIDAQSAWNKKDILPKSVDWSKAEKIPSVAQKDIRTELPEVKEIAINKYFEVKEGDSDLLVVIDALHSVKPPKSLVRTVIGENRLESLPNGEELVDAVAKENIESYTKSIAEKLSEKLGVSVILPKRSRLHADANRHWFNRDEKTYSVKNIDSVVSTFEYPRSVKAALFWGLEKILQNAGRLDENEKLTKPFCRLSIHGMKDNRGFDFAIAGAGNAADEKLVEWFNQKMNDEIGKSGLSVDGVKPVSIVAKKEDPRSSEYSGAGSLSNFRKDIKGSQHPSFGEGFNTIQLEISSRLRKDEHLRGKVVDILGEVLKQVPDYFASASESKSV